MGFEKKSFIALFIKYVFCYPSGWPSGFTFRAFREASETRCFWKHNLNTPNFTSEFHQDSPVHSLIPFVAVPQKSKKRQAKYVFLGKSRRHSATVCEGICPYPKWIHSKHTNTFRVTFRIHLPDLPGPFRDSVFWTMANTAGMHSGRMIQIIKWTP